GHGRDDQGNQRPELKNNQSLSQPPRAPGKKYESFQDHTGLESRDDQRCVGAGGQTCNKPDSNDDASQPRIGQVTHNEGALQEGIERRQHRLDGNNSDHHCQAGVEEALSQKLRDDLPASGSFGLTYTHLNSPTGGPSRHHADEIAASDEQNQDRNTRE